MKFTGKAYAVISGTILLLSAMVIYWLGFPNLDDHATRLSAIVLVGLALTVVFMAVLAIIYSVMGVENKDQALGLPEGSVRALLAFSLVLIFVCLASFLFSEVSKSGYESEGKILTRVTETQLNDLKNNFVVAAEIAKDEKGKLLYEQVPDSTGKAIIDDVKHPLYSITYYPKPNKDAQDFGKQIFTTLATVFVSVVSFYFGSSVTSSAVGAGAKAAHGPDGNGKSTDLHGALTNALAESHNAQVAVDQASQDLASAQSELGKDPPNQQKQEAVQKAQKALDDARKNLQEKQRRVEAAQKDLKQVDPKSPRSNTDQADTH